MAADDRVEAPSPWADAAERIVQPGEILVREGDVSDDVFEVVDGTLEILCGPDLAVIDTAGASGS